eukprot:9334720-Karenia_brevis.AAC.1
MSNPNGSSNCRASRDTQHSYELLARGRFGFFGSPSFVFVWGPLSHARVKETRGPFAVGPPSQLG